MHTPVDHRAHAGARGVQVVRSPTLTVRHEGRSPDLDRNCPREGVSALLAAEDAEATGPRTGQQVGPRRRATRRSATWRVGLNEHEDEPVDQR